jgi:hypothetical protein
MLLITNIYKNEFIPTEFHLEQNYPNPFKGKTTIIYGVPYKTKVIIIVINTEGDVVEKLISKEQDAGIYEVEFNAVSSNSGFVRNLPVGAYYYQLIADKFSETKKMELIKL